MKKHKPVTLKQLQDLLSPTELKAFARGARFLFAEKEEAAEADVEREREEAKEKVRVLSELAERERDPARRSELLEEAAGIAMGYLDVE